MAQKKKGRAAAPKGKHAPSRKKVSWQGRREGIKTGLIAAIALVGVIGAVLGYLLDSSAVLAVNSAQDAAEESAVRLNEIVSENVASLVTETGDVPDWVEITNTGSEAVEIGKYSLLLDTSFNRMFTFPDYSLQPGECLVIRAGGVVSGQDKWNAPFKISASGGQSLVLMNAQSRAVDAVELPELSEDAAYYRTEDGGWMIGSPTPGQDNASASAGEGQAADVQVVAGTVAVSEIMASNNLYFPDENGEYHDYVEIHNISGQDVNLEGWYLADSSDSLKDWAFPAVTLPAGGYLAVHCSGLNRTEDINHLHTDFKIGSDGECIYLTQPDGHTVSAVETPALMIGQAYSILEGLWTTELGATPGLENSEAAAASMLSATFGDRSNDVYISEIMASPSQQDYDWIEIYNGSGQAVDLSDYGLSDDIDKPRKWQFPAGTTIQPGQYMGVYLSGTEAANLGGYLNADFALSAAGGYTVSLARPDGRIIDAAYLPRQYGGVSYGRAQGEQGFHFFMEGTPGLANSGQHYRRRAPEPESSVSGGLFKSGDSFTVELSAPAGYQIYYTLDCSDPDQSSTLYTGPIQISSTTILRSRALRDGCMPSFIDTQSYLYDVENEDSVYVVSVVSDPDNLYSDEKGIMVMGPNAWSEFPYGETNAGANFWMDWEREAHVELFEADGDLAISQGCGLKLHGQYSRATDVKAFKVIARNEYGSNRFEYPIFSDRDYDWYQSFLLRASGQDYDKTFMRDSVLTSLASGTSLLYQESEVGVCYLNGEYYSLFNLRERMSKHAICQFEGWEGLEDTLDMAKANEIEMQGSNESYAQLLEWIKKTDMSTQSAYDVLDSQIDIQNYIEYMAMEIFTGNGDTLNVKRYRSTAADGKWRWILFDLDWGFYVDTNSIGRWLEPGGMGTGKYTDNTLFIGCMKNPIFYEQFMTYFGQQMATTFSSENVMNAFMQQYEIIDGLIPAYQQKWNISADQMVKEMGRVYSYIETRPRKLLGYFQDALHLSNAEMEKYFGEAIRKIQEYESKGA